MKQDSTQFLKTVKYSAIALSALMVAGIVTLMVLARGKGEDITGIVAPALLITFVSSVVATAAAVFQKRVQKAIDIKSKNDLTV
jgi:O-antigen/teichoic acid export membrane protein